MRVWKLVPGSAETKSNKCGDGPREARFLAERMHEVRMSASTVRRDV